MKVDSHSHPLTMAADKPSLLHLTFLTNIIALRRTKSKSLPSIEERDIAKAS
jgi:hypothetical protein